jgi:hypothetical protein
MMTGSTQNPKDYPDSIKCEAIGCNSDVQYMTKIEVGEGRTISIFLCKKCRPKFCNIDNSLQTHAVPRASCDFIITCNPANQDRSETIL